MPGMAIRESALQRVHRCGRRMPALQAGTVRHACSDQRFKIATPLFRLPGPSHARRTCAEAVQAAGEDATLQEDAIAVAARELPPAAEVAAACQFMRLPIRFDSLAAEVGAGRAGGWQRRGGAGQHRHQPKPAVLLWAGPG